MIVVDTSILIDHLRGRPAPRELIRAALIRGEVVAASVLTRVEILSPKRSNEKAAVRALFAAVDWLTVTTEVADRAGQLARQYRRSHASIDVVDYVIAATAEHKNAQLWTRNVRHFPMFAGLTAPY